jgi:hypothetical protein
VTSPEIEATADATAGHDASAVRGLSAADAVAVTFVAAIVGAFLNPQWPVGALLVAAVVLVYGIFRVTRGLPLRRRALAMVASFVLALASAGVLVNRGY